MWQPTSGKAGVNARLGELARRAEFVLVWERLWPAIVSVLTLCSVFVAVSWLGLWLDVPRWGRIGGDLVFAAALLVALFYLVRLAWPSRAEALGRLDRDSGLPHRPASTLDDRLANAGDDQATRALWEVHRRRAEKAAAMLRLRLPSPRMAMRDRYALRAGALIALAGAAFIAGPEKYARLVAAFDWQTTGAISQGFRLDAWIDPPGYTGRPPIMLDVKGDAAASKRIEAPVGSNVIVRSSAGASVTVEADGALEAPKKSADSAGQEAADPATAGSSPAVPPVPGDSENHWTLRGDSRLVVRRYGNVLADYDIASIPDKPPVISLVGDPKSNVRGSLTLHYKIGDDYGVTGAEADFSKPIVGGKPITGRTLVDPPKMPLALPSGRGGLGEAETTTDVAESPWAGAQVTLVLSARDEAGNEGLSDPIQLTLPQRPFTKPLARALVEQRRDLVLSPDDHGAVNTAIAALMIAPDVFRTDASTYLGLNSILLRLKQAHGDSDLVDTANLMWEMALRIEDGDLSDAEHDLRALQQQLRDALSRGASDEEIKKLTDQLRAALDKFLNQLAQQAQRGDQQSRNQAIDRNLKTITPQDLKSLLDKLDQMARNGDLADAQRMLDQLQSLLENLQTARRGNQMGQMSRQMNQSLNELDRMTREQQELRDRTFRPRKNGQNGQQKQGTQQQQGDDQANQGDEDDDQSADNDDPNSPDSEQALQQRQQDLRQRLERLQQQMKRFGMKPQQGLDDAEKAMREAEKDLGQGRPGRDDAVGAQGRALDGLQRGAQQLAQQMQQQGMGQGQQAGPGNPNGAMQQGDNNPNSDPLGREAHDKTYDSQSRYDPLGVPAAQRAQRVLEELRRRLSDPSRPQEELDYLGRLMQRY
jgi:uncharacterized protein (TIGR02302 family)